MMNKNAAEILTNTAEKLQEKMEEKEFSPNVFVVPDKVHYLNEFVLIFVANFEIIIEEYSLTKNDIRVIFKILNNMKFGNLISLSNSTLAKELGIDKSNISKIIKKLRKTELIIEKDGSLFFNPHIATKGNMNEKDEDKKQLLDYSAMILEENNSKITPSIGTDNIRKMIREKNKEKKRLDREETQKMIDEFYENKTYLVNENQRDFEKKTDFENSK